MDKVIKIDDELNMLIDANRKITTPIGPKTLEGVPRLEDAEMKHKNEMRALGNVLNLQETQLHQTVCTEHEYTDVVFSATGQPVIKYKICKKCGMKKPLSFSAHYQENENQATPLEVNEGCPFDELNCFNPEIKGVPKLNKEVDDFVEFKIKRYDHTTIVLTNKQGDTYTSKSEELMDFLHNAKAAVNNNPPSLEVKNIEG